MTTATDQHPTNLGDIAGRNAIITGAAMGIGFAIAHRFVRAGANCVLVDRDEDHLARAIQRLDAPGQAVAVTADITDSQAGPLAVNACTETFGDVDILVNNAGIFPNRPALELTADELRHVLEVNVVGLVMMAQAVGRHMREHGHGGRIVNIASIDSLHPSMVGLAAYDTSKGGVLMFTKSFALEMAAHGVNVNAIAPGGIATEGASSPMAGMSPEQLQAAMEQFLSQVPLRTIGEPDHIARAAQFLASDGADYMTGSLMVVDGGRLLM